MQTIVINSQKGGSGKTMLCKHLVSMRKTGPSPARSASTATTRKEL